MLITLSNLYPRPDQPTRGMYNQYLFREFSHCLERRTQAYANICLVPEWRPWRWRAIRCWYAPDHKRDAAFYTSYFPVPYLPLVGRSVNDRFYAWALRKWAKTLSPGDCVYVPWIYPDGVAVARAVRDSKVRLWLMALGSDTLHLHSAVRRQKLVAACKQAEGIICVARVLADRLNGAGVPNEKIHVIPNGVDPSIFRVRNKNELSVQGYPVTILFVGNLVPVKGPDVVLRAFARCIHRDQPTRDPHLLLIGSGPMQSQLQCLASELGITDHVHFLGRRSPGEVAQWMNVSDVLCLSSRSEGMPNVVLEARASGLPVVATPAGAVPELPLAPEHFLVVKSCSPEDVSKGLEEMLGRDLSRRISDPVIPTWKHQADKVMGLMGMACNLGLT